MDTVLTDLLAHIEVFIAIGNKITNDLITLHQAHRLSDEGLTDWQELMSRAQKRYDSIHQSITHYNGIVPSNHQQIDGYLIFFRGLSKALDYQAYHLSAFHEEIKKSLKKIVILNYEIDKKYKLGWEKDEYRKSSSPKNSSKSNEPKDSNQDDFWT